MDLEKPLTFDDECFKFQSDQILYDPLLPCQFDLGFWNDSEKNQENSISNPYLQITEKIKSETSLAYTPMEQLIKMFQRENFNQNLCENQIRKILRKQKLVEKREKAKKRENYHQNNLFINFPEMNTSFAQTETKAKKQKNRLFAQISRDKKKQYFLSLEKQNKIHKEQLERLQKENIQLKNKNNRFKSSIEKSLIFFVDLLKNSFSKKNFSYDKAQIPQISLQSQDRIQIEKNFKESGLNINLDGFRECSVKGKKYIPKKIASKIETVVHTYL